MKIPIKYMEHKNKIYIVWPDGTIQDTAYLPCGITLEKIPSAKKQIPHIKSEPE